MRKNISWRTEDESRKNNEPNETEFFHTPTLLVSPHTVKVKENDATIT